MRANHSNPTGNLAGPRYSVRHNKLDHSQRTVIQTVIATAITNTVETRLEKEMTDLSKRLSNKRSPIDEAITFNQSRLNKLIDTKSSIYKRLEQRQKELDALKKEVEESLAGPRRTFIGLVGWGEGCLHSDIRSRQNISAVDGYLYLEHRTGKLCYQRLESCLERFLDSDNKQQAVSDQSNANKPTIIETLMDGLIHTMYERVHEIT